MRAPLLFLLLFAALPAAGQGTDIGSIMAWRLDHIIQQPPTEAMLMQYTDTTHEGWTAYVIRRKGHLQHAHVRTGDVCYLVVPMPLKGLMFCGHMEVPCDQHTAAGDLVRYLLRAKAALRTG